MTCSVIIATLDRPESLMLVLRCLAAQSRPPAELLIADAGDVRITKELIASVRLPFPAHVLACPEKSSARQRNLAAEQANGDLLAFLDDDIEFGPDLFERTLAHFVATGIGAVHPRISNSDRPRPGALTRLYYRIQAGYTHPDYGARLFGPGINCFPVFDSSTPERVPSDWLPSTCLFIRADLFRRHRFPLFTGYSFAEDVHLTARAAREAGVMFLREPSLLHHSAPSEFKTNVAALTAGKLRNMAVVAREVQGLGPASLAWRWNLHRLFVTLSLLARRPARWTEELRGIWSARLR